MTVLRDYWELGKNKNILSHLLVETCSFPGSFEMTETIREYQNMFPSQKNPECSAEGWGREWLRPLILAFADFQEIC